MKSKAGEKFERELMEKASSAVAVPFRLGNLIHDDSAVTTHVEINGLKLIANTATLFSNPSGKSNPPCESISHGNEGFCHDSPRSGDKGADEFTSLGNHFVGNSFSRFLSSDTSNMIKSQKTMDVGKSSLTESSTDLEHGQDIVSAEVGFEGKDSDGSDESDPYTSTSLVAVSQKKAPNRTRSSPNVFGLDCLPLWGFTCICGRRTEMEDAVAVIPRLLQVPVEMLEDDHHVVNGVNQRLCWSRTAHFFGVYDGHGGSQVLLFIFYESHFFPFVLQFVYAEIHVCMFFVRILEV